MRVVLQLRVVIIQDSCWCWEEKVLCGCDYIFGMCCDDDRRGFLRKRRGESAGEGAGVREGISQ